jgi:hypothetical protein
MSEMPDLSIITSVYRARRHLRTFGGAIERTCASVLASGLSVEWVVVANAPSRREARILHRVTTRLGERGVAVQSILLKERESLYASWNRGVRRGRGRVCAFWNVDDFRNPAALVGGVRAIDNGTPLAYFPFVEVWLRHSVLSSGVRKADFVDPPGFNRLEFSRSMHTGPFFMFARSLYDQVGPFDEQFRIAGDFEWVARAAVATEFVRGSEIGGLFVRGEGTLSGGPELRQVAENNVVYLRYGAFDKVTTVPEELMGQYQIGWRCQGGRSWVKPSGKYHPHA